MKNTITICLINIFWLLSPAVTTGQCIDSNTGSTMAMAKGLWAQGFTAPCGGFLNKVSFTSASPGNILADTLRVYAGNSVSGVPIYQQYFSNMNNPSNGSPISITISGTLPIVNGNQYTFEFNPFNVLVRGGSSSYLGGNAFFNGNASPIDLDFEVIIGNTVGIEKHSPNSTNVYPNPTTGQLFISLEEGTVSSVSIKNYLGQKMFLDKSLSGDQLKIDVTYYPSGIYFVQLKVKDQLITKKIIKE